MHFRFYRGTRAGFLNLIRVDIWTRQVFVGEGTCASQGVSQRPWPLSTGCTSHLLPQSWQQKCVQTLLVRYPWGSQFLAENHWAGVNAGFPLFFKREILLTWLEWWRWSWDEQMGLQSQEMNSAVLGWTDPSRWSSPQYSLSASLLQHSTCSEERIWSCVGDTQCWMAKDRMWNVKFSFILL